MLGACGLLWLLLFSVKEESQAEGEGRGECAGSWERREKVDEWTQELLRWLNTTYSPLHRPVAAPEFLHLKDAEI